MKIVVTGKGSSGSWQVRGVQLGRAIGASIEPKSRDLRTADLIIAIKRVPEQLLNTIRSSKRFWVWDVVDAWPTPATCMWDKMQAVEWLHSEILRLRPNAIVFPTTIMQEDSYWNGPHLVLPHHAWPKYVRNEIRPSIEVVGYEGGAHYLGRWADIVKEKCRKRGWQFQINGDMQKADIGIALRDPLPYPTKMWKSNCKLANIQALGIPAVVSPEWSYDEFGAGGENKAYFPEDPCDIDIIFEALQKQEVRQHYGDMMYNNAIRLERVAKDYKTWLEQLSF